MSVSLAPRRSHPSLVFVANSLSRLRALTPTPQPLVETPLDGDQIFGDEGQILTAPPETELAPDTGSSPAPLDLVDALPLHVQIAAIDDAHFLRLNLEADDQERSLLRQQIETWRRSEEDAKHCGFGCDFAPEIERAEQRIADLSDRLEGFDLLAEIG